MPVTNDEALLVELMKLMAAGVTVVFRPVRYGHFARAFIIELRQGLRSVSKQENEPPPNIQPTWWADLLVEMSRELFVAKEEQ